MTERERLILSAWDGTDEDFDVLSFDAIAERSGVAARHIRRSVRRMARNGFTRFVRGCWTEDGKPAGSGYGLTAAGRAALATLEAPDA